MIKRSTNVFSRRILLGVMFLLTAAIAFPQVCAAKGRVNVALWVANNASTTIYEFIAADLPTPASVSAVTLVPNVILSDDGAGSIQGPWALIFDTAGNLWSSNANTPFTVVEFAPSV
ncbi:MAG TPA: hypothetical protein VND20_10530, partial [Candidatus Binataceae bacterium]|nr:hypothetical protein [Candidatus Binataceae bacterium]